MTVVVPNALALATIADGAAIVASDHRNNYSATQVGVNGLIAMFTVAATKGDLIVSAGGGSFDHLPVGTNGQAIVADSTQPLGMKWGTTSAVTYRKTTAKQVVNSLVETDLLNGEITVAAGALGTSNVLRLAARGDWIQNTGSGQATPRFKLKLGATTLLDTSTSGGTPTPSNANRMPWAIDVLIAELGATNAQSAHMVGRMYSTSVITTYGVLFVTGEGLNIAATPANGFMLFEGWNSGAVDATASQALTLTVSLQVANAAHDVTLKNALVVIE